jgi:hypothetical protein
VLAALIIVVAGLLATLGMYIIDPSKPDGSYVEFGSNLINVLSIAWIIIVLARFEKRTDAVFGRAMRKEISTILLMIFVSGAYSAIKLLRSF